MTVTELKQYIFNNNKIKYVLEQLGCHQIKYNSNKEYYSASHKDGDNPMGVVINNNEYLTYISYSRDVTYEDNKDLISLIEETNNVSFVDAIKYLHKLFGLSYSYKRKIKQEKKIDNPLSIFEKHISKKIVDVNDIHSINEDILDDYIPIPYIDWYREGVMPWTCKKFGIAYSYKKKRVIIPMRYWMTGELLGINSRTTVENYKELGIKKFYITPTYQKSLNLYGLYENYDSIQKAGYVVVYEAEKSVLKRDSKNDSTGVALSGHTISDEQVRILIGLNVDIIIAMDNDIRTDEVRFMCEKFLNIRNVYYIKDKWNLLGDKDSVADTSNKVFDFLMKYKIKYDAEEHREYLKSLERDKTT